jgi:hypothetical protein
MRYPPTDGTWVAAQHGLSFDEMICGADAAEIGLADGEHRRVGGEQSHPGVL